MGRWVRATNNLLIAITENQQKQAEAEAKVSKLSRYDRLTGLPTREMLLDVLGRALLEHQKDGQSLAVFFCGLDDFKNVIVDNGYHLGDRLLQILAERLSQSGPSGPRLVARLGSDQFVLVERRRKTPSTPG